MSLRHDPASLNAVTLDKEALFNVAYNETDNISA